MKKNNEIVRAVILITQIGFTVVVTVFLCIWFGGWLDHTFGTSFWFYIFLVLGFLAAFRNVYEMIRRFQAAQKGEEDKFQQYLKELRNSGGESRDDGGNKPGGS